MKKHEEQRIDIKKVVLTTLLILESDGLVSGFFGFSQVTSSWFYSALICMATLIVFFLVFIKKTFVQNILFFLPIIACIIFIFVSTISALLVFPKPIMDWLPSLYLFAPICIFYLLYLLDVGPKVIQNSFIIVSIIVTALVVFDKVQYLEFLDPYTRRSVFFSLDVRRVVILKNEVIFGTLILIAHSLCSNISTKTRIVSLFTAITIFTVQTMVMESRMGVLAMVVGVLALLFVSRIGNRTFIGIILVLFLSAAFGLAVFEEHIDKIVKMDIYDEGSNVLIRYETVIHYYNIFLRSDGWGIGQMSPSGVINNVLNYDERLNIADAGFISSLFQFGPLGFLIWVVYTSMCTRESLRHHRVFENPLSASVFAFFMGFTISVLPISFFTSSWCIALGGIFLYLTWTFRLELCDGQLLDENA